MERWSGCFGKSLNWKGRRREGWKGGSRIGIVEIRIFRRIEVVRLVSEGYVSLAGFGGCQMAIFRISGVVSS